MRRIVVSGDIFEQLPSPGELRIDARRSGSDDAKNDAIGRVIVARHDERESDDAESQNKPTTANTVGSLLIIRGQDWRDFEELSPGDVAQRSFDPARLLAWLRQFPAGVMPVRLERMPEIVVSALMGDPRFHIELPDTVETAREVTRRLGHGERPACFGEATCRVCPYRPHCHGLLNNAQRSAVREAARVVGEAENGPRGRDFGPATVPGDGGAFPAPGAVAEPQPAYLVLRSDCSNHCQFCTFKNMDPPGSTYELESLAEIGRKILAARRQGSTTLLIVGTEPLSYPNLPQIIALARKSGFTGVGLQTHAEDFDDAALVARCVQAGLTEVRTALYGPSAAIHDAVARTPGAFERLSRAVPLLRAAGVTVRIHATLCRDNLHVMDAIAALAEEWGCPVGEIKHVAPFTRDLDWYRHVVPTAAEVTQAAVAAFRRARAARGLDFARTLLKKMLSTQLPGCVVWRTLAPESDVPMPYGAHTWGTPPPATNLQMSAHLFGPDGRVSERFLSESKHDIKTRVRCPHADTCAFGVGCVGLYLDDLRAYGGAELAPVTAAEAEAAHARAR